MKKTISLLLALMLCLSLCACGGGKDAHDTKGNEEINNAIESQVEATEDPALEAEREKQYNIALRKLETSVFDGQSAAFKEAYEILIQLGDYKDAQAYLEKYTILPDMRLMETCSEINAFGEEVNSCSRTMAMTQRVKLYMTRRIAPTLTTPRQELFTPITKKVL